MEDQKRLDSTFERLIEYFQTSRFQYLALDYAGSSIRLSREQPSNVGGSLQDTRESAAIAGDTCAAQVLASSVGFVDLPPGRDRFPGAGEHVAEGDCLFAIRRFKNVVEVRAAAAGSLASILVTKDAFVEFGQPLATIG
ncbi:MAG: hypothetical protein HY526_02060 [Betaproteobacteria bacterium]|nr:hypothetical protein [Betaproteobacteria bacterium]